MARMTAIPLEEEVYYPESDGEPVAESELHLEELIYVWQGLKDRYEEEPDVFVGANLFLYYRKGDPSAVVAPDGFVVKGVPKLLPGNRRRSKYVLWEEGKVPCFVLETTSESTRRKDEKKKDTYEKLGIAEYFQFDPLGEYLSPSLRGFRLAGGRYRPIPPNPDGSLLSQATGVVFRADGSQLRLMDAATGAPLLRKEEEAKVRREAEKAQREAEKACRKAAEKAAVEAKARLRAEEHAAAETKARLEAEQRIQALEEQLARLQGRPASS
jgi:Uma2 family endonuclease